MATLRKSLLCWMILALLCGTISIVFAATTDGNEKTMMPMSATHFEYAQAPDGLYMFIYHGSAPFEKNGV